MATVDDLTAAVRKLSAPVKELEGSSAQELVDNSVPAGSVREVTQIRDEHGEVTIQATTWRTPRSERE